MKVVTIRHCSSNPNFTHGITRNITKPLCVVMPQIKQCQVAILNNPQDAIKSESLQFQVRKCPIYGQHMGAPQRIICRY
jgi:hypothetical protein